MKAAVLVIRQQAAGNYQVHKFKHNGIFKAEFFCATLLY